MRELSDLLRLSHNWVRRSLKIYPMSYPIILTSDTNYMHF